MFSHHRTVLIVALIALVNMLGYGIAWPLMYGFSKKFGLSDFGIGMLITSYSIGQFISTPIIGRLSDTYGRKPLLLVSVAGTAVSFFMMAFATGPVMLFVARVLDGFTAGNIPVAFAVISDSTKPSERPRAFGLIGSAFNFGFVFGPAIASMTVGMSASLPFVIAGIITTLAVILTALYLPETNAQKGTRHTSKLFDFHLLYHTLAKPGVGPLFTISLLFMLAFACALIYGFQPYTTKILGLSESQNALLFTLFGVVGLITQNVVVAPVIKYFGPSKAFAHALTGVTIALTVMYLGSLLPIFVLGAILLALSNGVAQTLITTMISQKSDPHEQGMVMGLNSSYQSIGLIIGPLLAGAVSTYGTGMPIITGALVMGYCVYLAHSVSRVQKIL